jgi:hypothetical protein
MKSIVLLLRYRTSRATQTSRRYSRLTQLLLFRMEFDALPAINDREVYLEVEMLFNDPEQMPKTAQDSVIGACRFRIEGITKGIKEYVCTNFQNSHFSVLNVTIHSMLTEFRYRSTKESISELTEAEINKLIFEHKGNNEAENRETMLSFVSKNSKGKEGTPASKKIEELCKDLKETLIRQHEDLLREYSVILEKCLFDKHKKKYSEYLQQKPSKIEIPDLYSDPEFAATISNMSNDPNLLRGQQNLTDQDRLSNFSSDCSYIGGELLFLWHKYLDLIRISPRFFLCFYELDYHDKIQKK